MKRLTWFVPAVILVAAMVTVFACAASEDVFAQEQPQTKAAPVQPQKAQQLAPETQQALRALQSRIGAISYAMQVLQRDQDATLADWQRAVAQLKATGCDLDPATVGCKPQEPTAEKPAPKTEPKK